MKIACCTMEMIALIFLLFVSMNGAFSYANAPARADLISKPTTELVSAWGTPDEVVGSADIGLNSPQLADVEVWSYYHPVRSVVVRDDIVVSIREG